jgi:hypothetical protein
VNTNDTPETDAVAIKNIYGVASEVDVDFARKLERERDEARESNLGLATELTAITAQRDEWAKLCGQYKQHRDEAIRHLENHTTSTIHSCHEQCQRPMCVLRRERDEARGALKHIEEYSTEEINAAVDLRHKLATALVERDEARKKTERQRERIAYLEGATHHACGTPLSKAIKERDEARAELADWQDSAKNVRKEYDDEQHCSCVPILRKLLKDAERERDEAREKLNEEMKWPHQTHKELVEAQCKLLDIEYDKLKS